MPPSLRYAKISLRTFTNKTSQSTYCFYFLINFSTCFQFITFTETALSKGFKYIQMTKSNQMVFPHFLLIQMTTLAFGIVDQLFPSYKLLCPGYSWQCINPPNHLLFAFSLFPDKTAVLPPVT